MMFVIFTARNDIQKTHQTRKLHTTGETQTMKKTLRGAALALSIIMLLATLCTSLLGCELDTGNGTEETQEITSEETTVTQGSETTDNTETEANGKADYTVTVTTVGGRPVPKLTFYVY